MGLFSSKAKNELEKLVEENDELKNTLHQVLQKHQNLIELDNKLNEARKEFSDIAKSIEKHKDDLGTLLSETDTKTEKIQALNETIEFLTDKKLSLESSISDLEIRFQEEGIEKRNENYDDLSLSYEKLKEEYDLLKNSISELSNEREKLDSAIGEYENNLEAADLNETIKQLKAEEAKRIASIKVLDEKITLSEEIKSNLESSLSAIIGQLSEKEKLYSEFTIQRDSISEELRAKQKEFDGFEARYNFTKETIGTLDSEVKELTYKRDELSAEVRRFEVIKNELQDKLLQIRNEEENLSESLKLKQHAIEEIEKRKFEIEETHLKVENNFSQILLKFTEELNSSKNKFTSLRQDILEKEKELSHKEKILLEKTSQVAEYGGMTKVLQKERAAAEQLLSNLKQEFNELNNLVIGLKDEANRHKLFMQQLRSETSSLEIKKESLEKDIRQFLNQTNENYSALSDSKQKLSIEIAQNMQELETLRDQLANQKNELRFLKAETAATEVKKEEYTAKISELISVEKNLKFRIAEHEKKINLIDGKN